MELYKESRPETLEGVVGNVSTVKTLNNMIEKDTVPHTILFHGPSGCGKTTLGRIVKTLLNCHDLCYTELNISDFRGVDTVREIRETMNLSPVGGDCRIWLLDEVHMMTKPAQNAILKILEDTPRHVYFILCTTEPRKLIKTVRSRCCELPVELLSDDNIKRLLVRVIKRNKIKITRDLVDDIIDASEGSGRKCLVLLDRVINLPKDERADSIKEDADDVEGIHLCRALLDQKSWSRIAKILKEIKGEPESLRWSVMRYCRSVLLSGKTNHHAFHILTCFENHFYDSKDCGLMRASYEAIHGNETEEE